MVRLSIDTNQFSFPTKVGTQGRKPVRLMTLGPDLRRGRGVWVETDAKNPLNGEMRERDLQPAVYLLTSQRNGTLYCGSTGDLVRRVWEHREGVGSRFTAKYGVTRLVWFEFHGEMGAAIRREHQIKEWKRAWKLRLIEEENPTWRDLYDDLI